MFAAADVTCAPKLHTPALTVPAALPLWYAADVPKALVGAAILRDQARPEWPDSSSTVRAVVAAAAAVAGAAAHEASPPMAYRELANACWAHEARDRWATLAELGRHSVPAASATCDGEGLECQAGKPTRLQRSAVVCMPQE